MNRLEAEYETDSKCSEMNSSPSRLNTAWSGVKPVVTFPFELGMMVVMMGSLALLSSFDGIKKKVLGDLPSRHDAISTSCRSVSSNATEFIMSQVRSTRQSESDVKRQTYWVKGAGSLDNLELRSDYIERPESIPSDEVTALLHPQGFQVQVAVRAIGLNMADVFAVQGLYSATPTGDFIPGLEFAGVITRLSPEYEYFVSSGGFARQQETRSRAFAARRAFNDSMAEANREALGGDEKKDALEAENFTAPEASTLKYLPSRPFQVGDRVMGVTRFGAYSTVVNADARLLRIIPQGWSFAEGAGYLVQGLTAVYGLLRIGQAKRDDVVLVHSAAGGVGQLTLEVCRSIGAYPIATVGSAKKAAYLSKKVGSDMHISQIIDRSACGMEPRNPLRPVADFVSSLYQAAAERQSQLQEDEKASGLLGSAAVPLLRVVSLAVSLGVAITGPVVELAAGAFCRRQRAADDFGSALDMAMKAISAGKKARNQLEFASNLSCNSNNTDVTNVTRSLMKIKDMKADASLAKLVKKRPLSDKREMVLKSPSMVVGVDVVMDSLLGPCFQPTLERLAPQGRIVVFGAGNFATTSAKPSMLHLGWEYLKRPLVDPMDLTSNNTSVSGFNLIWLWSKLEEFDELYDLMQTHIKTKPTVGKTFDFKHLRKGLAYLQSGASVGKVVVLVGEQ